MIQLFVYNNNNINKEGAIIIQITAIFFGGVIIHGHPRRITRKMLQKKVCSSSELVAEAYFLLPSMGTWGHIV